jgi:hypothetical protein
MAAAITMVVPIIGISIVIGTTMMMMMMMIMMTDIITGDTTAEATVGAIMEAAGTLGTVARRITQSKTACANHIVATEIRKKGTQQDHCNASEETVRTGRTALWRPRQFRQQHDERADRAVITAMPIGEVCQFSDIRVFGADGLPPSVKAAADRTIKAWYHFAIAWHDPNRRVTWQSTSAGENL